MILGFFSVGFVAYRRKGQADAAANCLSDHLSRSEQKAAHGAAFSFLLDRHDGPIASFGQPQDTQFFNFENPTGFNCAMKQKPIGVNCILISTGVSFMR